MQPGWKLMDQLADTPDQRMTISELEGCLVDLGFPAEDMAEITSKFLCVLPGNEWLGSGYHINFVLWWDQHQPWIRLEEVELLQFHQRKEKRNYTSVTIIVGIADDGICTWRWNMYIPEANTSILPILIEQKIDGHMFASLSQEDIAIPSFLSLTSSF